MVPVVLCGKCPQPGIGEKDIPAVGLGPIIRDQLRGSREAQDGLARAVAKRRGCPQTPRP